MKKTTEAKPATTTEEAAAVLAKAREERVAACMQDLQSVLTKHGCMLVASMVLRAGVVIPRIDVEPKE